MSDRLRRPLVASACVFVLACALETGWLQWLSPLQARVSDSLLRAQAQGLAPDPGIVIVDIDEASLARLQDEAGRFPWPRAVYAELLAGLLPQQPQAVVFDLWFTERDVVRPESDEAFIAGLEQLPGSERVYFPLLRFDAANDAQALPLRELAGVLPLQRTARADADARAALLPPLVLPPLVLPQRFWKQSGLINFAEDADGVGRHYWLQMELQGWRLPSLPARVAQDLGWAVPDTQQLRLHWRGGPGAFTRVSFADLYDDFQRRERRRPADEFSNRIVIIGTTAAGQHDLRVTPFSNLHPGVEILATAFDNLKNARWLLPVQRPWPAAAGMLLILSLLLAFRLHWHPVAIGAGLLLLTLAGFAGEYAALQRLRVVPVFTPLLFAWGFFATAAMFEFLRERRKRAQAVRLFGRFLNPEVVNRLVERGETVESLSGRTCEISVLFSDIRGFTSLSETRPPQEIVQLLNRYFSRQVAIVFKHGGTLDKFIGDCIMAFWGAPLDDPRHAQRAVACALDMQRELLAFKAELGPDGAIFDVGIGIHSGVAVVGFIGAEQKLDYTAIGDTVNLASRIEGMTKGIARILVSADTVQACGDPSRFAARGAHHVKGRNQPVELFEPTSAPLEPPPGFASTRAGEGSS